MKLRRVVLEGLMVGLAVCAQPLAAVEERAENAALVPRTPTAATAGSIVMNQIQAIQTPVRRILSKEHLDFDHDGKREFIITREASYPANSPFEFYECVADNTFVLVHVLDLETDANDSYSPADAGDIDGDGLADLTVRGLDWVPNSGADYGLWVYESASPSTYPTALVWQVVAAFDAPVVGGVIVDGDGDGQLEIVANVPGPAGPVFAVYENDGDNSYPQTFSGPVTAEGQSFGVLTDLDEDGRKEMLHGGGGKITAFESSADDTYEVSWSWLFNPVINVVFIVDAGDLDGDGRKEFLAGGLKPISQPGDSFVIHLNVFEAVADDTVEIVATLVRPISNGFYSSAAVADVDGDGRKEIIFGTHWDVAIYRNTGDNAWQEIWVSPSGAGPVQSIGAADHDRDGKAEILFQAGTSTRVYEIHPAYAADVDGDGRVDAIDNCVSVSNPSQSDLDADGLGDACDNCIWGPNPEQGPAVLGQTILASTASTFAWPVRASVVYARGELSVVSTYTTNLVGSLVNATSWGDATVPPSGAGFYYVMRPNCPLGSWQSSLGAEPDRDVALP